MAYATAACCFTCGCLATLPPLTFPLAADAGVAFFTSFSALFAIDVFVVAFFIVNTFVMSDVFRVPSQASYLRPARPFFTFFLVDFFLGAAFFGAFFLMLVGAPAGAIMVIAMWDAGAPVLRRWRGDA